MFRFGKHGSRAKASVRIYAKGESLTGFMVVCVWSGMVTHGEEQKNMPRSGGVFTMFRKHLL